MTLEIKGYLKVKLNSLTLSSYFYFEMLLNSRKREAHEVVYAMCCNVEQTWGMVRLVRMHGPKFWTITVTVSPKVTTTLENSINNCISCIWLWKFEIFCFDCRQVVSAARLCNPNLATKVVVPWRRSRLFILFSSSSNAFLVIWMICFTWNAEKGRRQQERKSTTCGKVEILLSLAKRHLLLLGLYVCLPIDILFIQNLRFGVLLDSPHSSALPWSDILSSCVFKIRLCPPVTG